MSKVVSFLEAIAAYRDSLPVNSSDGRSTLLSLMDAMSEVPPLDASQPLLLPVPALGPKGALPLICGGQKAVCLPPTVGAVPFLWPNICMLALGAFGRPLCDDLCQERSLGSQAPWRHL